MKTYKKNKIKNKDGMLVTKKGKIITIDPEIIDLANYLETLYQKAQHDMTIKMLTPTINNEFERVSEHEIDCEFEVDTPILDEQVEQSIKLMHEIDAVNNANKANIMLENMKPLVDFVSDDYIVACSSDRIHKFDTPNLGDPLGWTIDSLLDAIAFINGGKAVDYE